MAGEIKVNALDRLIGWASPAAGMARLRQRVLWNLAATQGGYHGGRRDRRQTRGWRPKDDSANAATLLDLPHLRTRARDLIRNMPIATGAVATVTTHVVGDGVRLNPTIDHEALGLAPVAAQAWNDAARREFALFCRTADWTRTQSFDELQGLIFRAALESGDVFLLRRFRRDPGDVYGLKVQVIEADRVENPNRRFDSEDQAGGIEHDANGLPVAVHIANHHPGALLATATSWARVPIRDQRGDPQVLHLFDKLRPDQARGVPYLAPVIESLHQLGTYSDAEVRAAVLSAFLALFVTKPDGDDDVNPIVGSTATADGVADVAKELALPEGGALVSLLPGEKVEAPSPGRPNDRFDPFVQAMLRQIGVALELPYELLIKHFTASYSASRAALELAWAYFRRRRVWLVRHVNQPVYEWVIDEAVASGRLAAPGYFRDPATRAAYLKAEWIGQPRSSIDPLKEANADAKDIESRVKTRAQVVAERTGGDWRDKHEQLMREAEAAREAGFNTLPAPAAPAGPGAAAPDEEEDDDDASTDRE